MQLEDHEVRQPSQESLENGYEVSDINVKVVNLFLVILTVMTIGAMFVIIVVMRGLESAHPKADLTPLQPPVTEAAAPGPRLQWDARRDRDETLRAAEAHLNSYGWVSDHDGYRRAHIPVEQAMRLLADGVAPYRPEPVSARIGEIAEPAPETGEASADAPAS